ncbi:MAG: XTP/dITP diphosphatase [Ruminococcaceae bacterium]|nr:XTP/dITP diphosphatase [Oscillospiraceae bacterium]
MKLLVATNNQGKLKEFNKILGELGIECVSLRDMGITADVEETGTTFLENALLKAKEIYKIAKIPTISDDSGLMVDALGGEPGVYSARYAGEPSDDNKNMDKLLAKLKDEPNRTARFKSVIAAVFSEDDILVSEGECEGVIIDEKRGDNGFGYDPIFYVEALEKTFAEMTDSEKNSLSHRGNAIRNLKEQLKEKEL